MELLNFKLRNGSANLKDIPHLKQTFENCKNAVANDSKNLQYVAPIFLNEKFYLETSRLNILVIEKIPSSVKTINFLKQAISLKPEIILALDDKEVTLELCILATVKNPFFFNSETAFPTKFITPLFYQKTIFEDTKFIKKLYKKQISSNLIF